MKIGEYIWEIFAQLICDPGRRPIAVELLSRFLIAGTRDYVSYLVVAELLKRERQTAALDLAVAAYAAQMENYPGLIHINCELSTLEAPESAHALVRTLGAAPHRARLVVEITESAVIRDPLVLEATLGALKDYGVTVAIDDFGTAFSLPLWVQLNQYISKVKLARELVQAGQHNPRARHILAGIVQALQGVTLTAEGIETEEQLAYLSAMGVTEFQGYLLHRPEPSARLRAPQAGRHALVPGSKRLPSLGCSNTALFR